MPELLKSINFPACFAFALAMSLVDVADAEAPMQADSPDAYMDWTTGKLCLPVEVLDGTSGLYDACLQMVSTEPTVLFKLDTLNPRAARMPGMASYSATQGLMIPVLRTSQGQTFVEAHLKLSGSDTLQLVDAEEAQFDARHTIARQWNEQLLAAIRRDLARPTVHSRNLFHTSVALYDAWAAYDETASPYLLNNTVNGFTCPFSGLPAMAGRSDADIHRAISYAAFRVLSYRFKHAPNGEETLQDFRNLMLAHRYDPDFVSTNYSTGDAAALGNYVAKCVLDYGLQDGAHEIDNYPSQYYTSRNPPLAPMLAGSQNIEDPNSWQPLSFQVVSDSSGVPHYEKVTGFLGSEWGSVAPFALDPQHLDLKVKDGNDHFLYHDPGAPPRLDLDGETANPEYLWNFATVVLWSSQLDPTDGVMWDISPASIGNLQSYPETFEEYQQFYNQMDGGDPSPGHSVNPATGQPYTAQWVPRGDYTRVLAEFWADGPDSETPPGHWFVILNQVNEHPQFERRFEGTGSPLDKLEWDVKSYLALGGAMHDSAVTAWSIKSWYDYIRPISAIRYLTDMALESATHPNLYPNGSPLAPGYVERVKAGDPLAGEQGEHVGKIKIKAWRGPDYIQNPATDMAGAGWILAENWWPYQRPTAVTPPFAGYISGHSTFSSAAAEVLTLISGDPYFPGGMAEFVARKNEYLKFEEGPSVDVRLQWATYRDASDQTSLSRIWGGIHPPVDDIPGRRIGKVIGEEAFAKAKALFSGTE